jgi:hypothetical protein
MIHINLEKYLYQGSERLRDSFNLMNAYLIIGNNALIAEAIKVGSPACSVRPIAEAKCGVHKK